MRIHIVTEIIKVRFDSGLACSQHHGDRSECSSQYQKRKKLANSAGKANISLVLTSNLSPGASFWTVCQAGGHYSSVGQEIS